MDIAFETVHGSHLYGLAHEGSDNDTFVVLSSQHAPMRQHVEGASDITTCGWGTFLEYALGGSHQSLEALYSTRKKWHDETLRPLLDAARANGGGVFHKYERTIKKFCFLDEKRRRHAVRLGLNLQDMRRRGWFDPTLTPAQVTYVRGLASRFEGDELLSRIEVA